MRVLAIRRSSVWLLGAALVLGAAPRAAVFEDAASPSGLDFVHFNGMSGEFYLPEIMGSGVALLDYDDDGDLDLYLVQGRMLGQGRSPAQALLPPPPGKPAGGRLYRNDLTTDADGRPRPRFTDVTAEAGLGFSDYGMGVATADYDGDGRVDLYLTNFGPNRLLRNAGNGRFEDATARAGVGDAGWGVSAAFLDYDRDGHADLFVGNYVSVDLQRHVPCRSPSSALDYCTPLAHKDQPDRLYRNRGDGTFEDVGAAAGIDGVFGPTLGVMVFDANGDGWPDLYLANDAKPNLLWINEKNGRFREDALFSGVAVNMAGAAEGSMGVAAGDFDNDGDEDLFMTHLTGETNTLYVNQGKGWFEDRSAGTGLGGPSKAYTGFGTGWLDFDNDGWLDVFVANGEVSVIRAPSRPGDPYPLAQPDQLFANRDGKGFEDVSAQAGADLSRPAVGRGVAFGDVDNDGDTDILVSNNSGSSHLLLNRVGDRHPWLGLDLRDRRGAPAVSARVEVRFERGRPLWRVVRSSGSYASAGDFRLLLGLADRGAVREIVVHWPDGRSESWKNLKPGAYHRLVQGDANTAVGDGAVGE
jgi:hypothetical protein